MGLKDSVERKIFEKVADDIIQKGRTEEGDQYFLSLIGKIQAIMGDIWRPETYENLKKIVGNKDSKWFRYTQRILRETDPNILKKLLLNAGYGSAFRGVKVTQANKIKYGANIPWLILLDPTTACNMHCTGCWAAEYGNRMNLSYEEMDSIITQGQALGINAYLFTGGEPLIRKADIIRLCEKHPDAMFHAFTNGTLIDAKFCEDLKRVGNFIMSISIEGFEEANDGRRGSGHYQKALAAMDLLRENHIPFGVSICYTSKNYLSVTSDAFLDMLIEKNCFFAWYFHYMPVGNSADTGLLLSPEQREYMLHKIRDIRAYEGGKEIFAIDFQNDGEFCNGCVAGGGRYCHINANGDVEPCVFIHYSGANIREKSLLECLKQPLFMEYMRRQPFNENLLRPCPMLENPEFLKEMVEKTGAVSTDLESPESAEHLSNKCAAYAQAWRPVADRIWEEETAKKE